MNTVKTVLVGTSLLFGTLNVLADGKSDYDTKCAACHIAGVAGAPKLGDTADWADRIAKGKDALYENAIKGYTGEKGVMPPKGGFINLTDEEVIAIVDYMISQSQ